MRSRGRLSTRLTRCKRPVLYRHWFPAGKDKETGKNYVFTWHDYQYHPHRHK